MPFTEKKTGDWSDALGTTTDYVVDLDTTICDVKNTTIRKGQRWREGDKFSPHVWSGKPYRSKQITIAPDITITQIYDIELVIRGDHKEFIVSQNGEIITGYSIETLANNDGLSLDDFLAWFDKPFQGQIIGWSEEILYKIPVMENEDYAIDAHSCNFTCDSEGVYSCDVCGKRSEYYNYRSDNF
ncbi:hypothetical protein SAMN05421780_11063 [Flexibacter flexilis DSM 6793]|uniref:Uncharacterized protein n=2 Tax=Flexibacter flexilis TaxID=998 RepID=A0A1I1MIC5_9BACT|nr:hypothetical protein SAMN05421780_11063 [Flexibacter flexilis DSM 6793]